MIIQDIHFKYKNNFTENTKGNDIIHPLCMLCGIKGKTSYKNYVKQINRNRLVYDKKYNGIHVCRKCSKKLLDTNPSILKKNSDGQKRLSKEIILKRTEWQKDETKKRNSFIKMVATCKEKYGEEYYKIKLGKTQTAELINKRVKSSKKTIKNKNKIFKQEAKNSIPILKEKIKNNELNQFDINNKIHIEFVRHILNIPKGCYVHPLLFTYCIEYIKNEKKEKTYKIISVKSSKGINNGKVKRGWVKIKNNILRFDSKAELTFIFSKLILFENNTITRNYKGFEYINSEMKLCKYYPDFYNNKEKKFYEIKYKSDYDKQKELIDLKAKICNAELCFFERMPKNSKTISKTLIDNFISD